MAAGADFARKPKLVAWLVAGWRDACLCCGADRRLVSFICGQGRMNVPNWAPDGHAFTFVRYALPG
jgi:hypothetical protein